ncbi:MAG: Gfo/Idh/MocA family oxidoreductase [Spirochaetales bacterium]|uniref:Gfo/Idh/MocA family oxidoreductase n=1 Tax=Candidatus Thalassospirochaeta sargassi TaxID=3119039 RepID=A0AAJ1IDK5_9SPIO|nr:Gfo/Idh/MocA family oxidoreductase [Spirochaetales bacterium]
MKKYKWGVIGTGKIANRFATALNNIADEAEFYAVGSRNQSTAEDFAAKYNAKKAYVGYDALMADPDLDVVYIGTPGKFHHDDVVRALEAGKNVLCEKSLTSNASEAEDLIKLARSKNLFFMEAMWTRFFPIHVRIRELIADGALGDVRGMVANFSAKVPGGPNDINRFWDVNLGASALLDIGAYGISFASSLFGKPEEINGVAYMGEAGFDYQNSSSIRYAGGRIATIMASQISYDVKETIIFGTEGKIEIDDPWYKPVSMTLTKAGMAPEKIEYPLDGFNGYEYEIREVQNCLSAGEKESTIMPLDESLEVIRTMDELRSQWGFKFPGEK